jgi:hypothetical protein
LASPGAIGRQALANQDLANQNPINQNPTNPGLANQAPANQGAAHPGMVGGLTSSEQSFLMNFGAPTAAGSIGPTPSEQMLSNAQSNAQGAVRSGASFGLNEPATQARAKVGGASSLSAPTDAQNASPPMAGSPAVNPPVVNNPGSLAETRQRGATP